MDTFDRILYIKLLISIANKTLNPIQFIGKVATFGGDSFNRLEVIHLPSWRSPPV